MPVSEDTWFHAMLLSGNRVQVPVLVRWRFRLEPGEVLRVKISPVELVFGPRISLPGCRREDA